MTIHLSEDMERFVLSEVQSGRFASPEEAINEALRLLQQKKREPKVQKSSLTTDELNRQMLEAGLLTQIPSCPDPATYEEFSPIVIHGEPISETIIRERR
jgi:putative addiction module CopG family antidote